MKTITISLLFVASLVIILVSSKPADKKCITQGRHFVANYVMNPATINEKEPAEPIISVKNNILYKSIFYRHQGKTIRLGYAYLGNIRLSYSTRTKG